MVTNAKPLAGWQKLSTTYVGVPGEHSCQEGHKTIRTLPNGSHIFRMSCSVRLGREPMYTRLLDVFRLAVGGGALCDGVKA
jgi:hypothetical protein